MADYDFASLSPFEFEHLVRDLLQAEHGRTYEAFKSGPDQGIDLRHIARDGAVTVVQCKHYASFSALLRAVRSELKKVARLRPARYILATSTPLSAYQKDQLVVILRPHVRTPNDILGRGDINGLLSRHPQVEEANFKLWLSSLKVLQRLTTHGVVEDTELALAAIRRRMRRYVPNDSFFRARDILEKLHYCVVAGIPGIGKTTLAELLVIEYVDRRGFQAVRITSDVSEVRGVRNPERKLIFFFDDFLGKTTLDKVNKNEDQRLLDFMAEVAEQPNWRFLLSTREYILNRARERYETLADRRIDLSKCVISLADYTEPIKAQILYNHIFFSDMPITHRRALLAREVYRSIVHHRNYSPRVIEHMLDRYERTDSEPHEFVTDFKAALQNPEMIWDHAFRFQLSPAARSALLVLVSLPRETFLDDFEQTFASLHRTRDSVPDSALHLEFMRLLRELDGNFVATRRVGKTILAKFHNPSLEDYLEQLIGADERTLIELLDHAIFFEQVENLAATAQQRKWALSDTAKRAFFTNANRTLREASCGVAYRYFLSEPEAVERRQPTFEERLASLVEMQHVLPRDAYDRSLEENFNTVRERIREGVAEAEPVLNLLNRAGIRPMGARSWVAMLPEALAFVTERLETLDEITSVTSFSEYSDLLGEERVAILKERFLSVARDVVEEFSDSTDLDEVLSAISSIEDIGRELQIPVKKLLLPLSHRVVELEADKDDEREGSGPVMQRQSAERIDASDIDTMFASLLRDLDLIAASDENPKESGAD